jgi:hypothetical protein
MRTNPAKFWHDILSPGTVTTADGDVEITREDVDLARTNFIAMQKTGIADIPVLAEHVPLTDPLGNPRPRREVAVDELNTTKGWIGRVRMKGDALQGLFQINDDDTAAGIKNGTIRYVSPTIRGQLEDRNGNPYRRAIAHVALTSKPRFRNQGEFEPVEENSMALSELGVESSITIEDVDDIQLADHGDEEGGSEHNPDLDNGGRSDPQMEALLTLLAEEFGLTVAADTDSSSLVEQLLTAVKTAKAVREKAAADKAADDANTNHDDRPIEDKTGVQMSEAQATQFAAMKKRLAENHGTTIRSRFASLKKSGRIAPALFDALADRIDSIQLSDEGDEQPSITLSELADLFEKTTGDGSGALDLSDDSEEEHPDGEGFRTGDGEGEVTDEETEVLVKRMGDSSYTAWDPMPVGAAS